MTKWRLSPGRLGLTALVLAAAFAGSTTRLAAIPVAPVMNAPVVLGPNSVIDLPDGASFQFVEIQARSLAWAVTRALRSGFASSRARARAGREGSSTP